MVCQGLREVPPDDTARFNETMFLAGELEEHHRDPADRMIIAAAKLAEVAVVTADRNFPLYGISVIY